MKVGVLATTLAILMIGGSAYAGPAVDTDSDGTFDVLDICSANAAAPVPNGLDTDMDGYGNQCDCDFNNDGLANGADFSAAGANNDFLDCFSGGDVAGLGCDMNGDTLVNGADFSSAGPGNDFLDCFATGVPGPSGLPCAGTVACP